jgi:uncharacterized protein (DUF302 family)
MHMQVVTDTPYGEVRATDGRFEDVVERMEAALKEEGFGVLCRIDIKAKLKEKLGVEFPKYVILGACNPPLAYQALEQDMNLGLLLPCNAVVFEQEGRIRAGLVDAEKMLSVAGHPEMHSVAREVNQKLRRALDRVIPSVSKQVV